MSNPLIILLVILGIVAVIGGTSYLIYRLTHKKKDQEKPSEEQSLKEELDRVLQPIEDEKTAEEIQNYKHPDDEE